MSADAKTEGKTEKEHDRRLTDLAAITVVVLAVFLAVCKVKDDNIVQAMQKALLTSVDAWTEYQAARIKLHVDENALSTLRLLETAGSIDKTLAAKQAAEYEADIKKYEERSRETRSKAERLEKEYERLNFHDDQFDVSEAFVSIAIALAAVAALVDAYWLLYVAWGSGGLGLLFGVGGFAGLNLRPGWFATLLGT